MTAKTSPYSYIYFQCKHVKSNMYFLGASLLFFVLGTANNLVYNEKVIIFMRFVAIYTTCLVAMSEIIPESFQAFIQKENQALITKENMLHDIIYCP